MNIRLKALLDIINFSSMDTYQSTNRQVLNRYYEILKILINQNFYYIPVDQIKWTKGFLDKKLNFVKLKNTFVPCLEKARANIEKEQKILVKNLNNCLLLAKNNQSRYFNFKVFKTDWKNNFQYAIFEIDQTKIKQYQILNFPYQINENQLKIIFDHQNN